MLASWAFRPGVFPDSLRMVSLRDRSCAMESGLKFGLVGSVGSFVARRYILLCGSCV